MPGTKNTSAKNTSAKNTSDVVTRSSGNVFKDLGFDRACEEQTKAHLIRELRAIIESRKLTQTAAGEMIGLAQSDLSQLLRGRTRGYTVDRLLRFLMAFDRDIDIRIRKRPKSRRQSRMAVTVG